MASTEEIDISPDGSSASATNGQHQVYFPGNIYNGVIKLVTPDGTVLQSQPIGLSYFDGSNSVLLAVVTNSTGQILPSGNQVIYTNAFTGLTASILYSYTKSGFEQDVVMESQPPDPVGLGLNPQTTRLQVLTEFFNPPQPGVSTTTMPTDAGNLEDDSLSFGAMQMGQGKAFLVGSSSPTVGVDKRWLVIQGRQFLVEEVPIVSIAKAIDSLPPFVAQTVAGTKAVVSKNLILPPQRLTGTAPKTRFLAKATQPSRGFVLDYQMLNSNQTNYTFRGDTTYYISGPVDLYGTNTVEGGAVLKYTNANFAEILFASSGINWLATAYRPVILTAKDDNSVGQSINGSTGHPTNYYALSALVFNNTSLNIANLRVAYAQQAIGFNGGSSGSIYNAQFVNCEVGITLTGMHLLLRNALFCNTPTNDFSLNPGGSVDAQNVTFSSNGCLAVGPSFQAGASLVLTNCVLANVTNLTNGVMTLSGDHNGFYHSTAFGTSQHTTNTYPFQTAAGGNYYLANNSTFRNVGTISIDPALLVELHTNTTYPPNTSFVNQTVTTYATLSPLGLANTNTPDLGYHYPVLDYVFSQCRVDGAAGGFLTFNPGTAVGWYGQGLALTNYATVNFDGLVASPCYFVRCNTVQEQDLTGDTNTIGITSVDINNQPAVQATFTRFSAAGGLATYFDASYLGITLYNCEFWGGLLGGKVSGGAVALELSLINCLLDRSSTAFYTGNSGPYWTLTMQNCTLHGGSLYLSQSNTTYIYTSDAQVYDSAFDGTLITVATTGITTGSHDAYLTNATKLPSESGDPAAQTNFNWQIGPLGNYYLPPGSTLIDAGNGAASGIQDLTGYTTRDLGIFTTQTNQVPESANNPAANVDISYHHAAPLQAQSFNNYQSPVCPNGTGSISLSGANNDWNNTTPDWWGLPVTFSIINYPQHGSLTNGVGLGDYVYTPNCYEGADSFTYQMNDGLFTSPVATVYTMAADIINATYSPSPAQTPVNTTLTITITASHSCGGSSVATNVVITSRPAHGTLSTLSGNPPLTGYTPTNGFSGIDSFVFQVSNGCGDTASFFAFITVTNSGTGGPFTVVTNIGGTIGGAGPIGIDYSSKENELIVSVNNGDSDFGGDDFLQLGTNTTGALTVSNFSGINYLSGEAELAIVKQNAGGFTNGNVFFSSGFNVGWLSGDGTQSNTDWSTLTNNTVANVVPINGGLYVDQTGVFSNDVIAVASDTPPQVWLANSNGSATLLAQITANAGGNLEGVISITNNTNQWGPWAGKVLTGDEGNGILYTIDTNGTVIPYDLGIAPDHFVLIPTNQDLYLCDYGKSPGQILKLSRAFLTNYVGDLLITQEGGGSSYPPGLFIVKWSGTNFTSQFINGNVVTNGFVQLEDAAFAPLNLPSQPILQ